MAIGPSYNYGPNPGKSGGDPRGRVQNQGQYQQQRYEQQQGPMVNAFAHNYGRGSESDYGNYTDIMNQYRSIASGAGGAGGEGGGGGGGGGPTGGYTPFTIGYNDPFKSYGGFEEFSQTGGYSPQDIANMRARGISPIRAAYSNAERELQRGRSLQGGYSPNMAAAQVKMAREQGQSAADATQNVEAGLAEARNRGRLSGLQGMYGVEGQRLGADLDVSKFNAQAQAQAQAQNIGAASAAAGRGAASAAASRADQLRALQGMSNLYGTTPGMSQMFGNQLLQGVGQGGTFGLGMMGKDIESQKLPGAYEQTMGRAKDIYNTGSQIAYPWLNDERRRRQGGGGAGNLPGESGGG